MAVNNMWDERFSASDYVYGTEPNNFFKSVIDSLIPGKILMPCEGEGRNAVYAATKQWTVDAFDGSKEGMRKAINLAYENKCSINYHIIDAEDFQTNEKYDAIGLIFAHFKPEQRYALHRKLIDCLKPGGIIILEAFNKKQISNDTGGPKDINMLYTPDILKNDFAGLSFAILKEETAILDEGHLHSGQAEVIRMKAVRSDN